jgi:NTE family protein
MDELHRADGVFEGGGVKGIAFAGAIAAAEQDAGVREWVNVAGTSAGAIVAALLVAGYDAAGLRRVMQTDYARFRDTGCPIWWVGGIRNALARMRGAAPGDYFEEWLSGHLAVSPLAKKLGKTQLTFADVRRDDLPPFSELHGVPRETYERARYRLHVIASDVTGGRMVVIPDDLHLYDDEHGESLKKDDFPVVRAVRMSMSYPFLFTPVVLHAGGKPYYIVDGGLLSNFPIWLFDNPAHPVRPTWGFRLHPGASVTEGTPYRKIPRPFWELPLLKAMFSASTEAWDRHQLEHYRDSTVSIPTHDVSTTNFGLTGPEADLLYQWGLDAAHAFFTTDPGKSRIPQR